MKTQKKSSFSIYSWLGIAIMLLGAFALLNTEVCWLKINYPTSFPHVAWGIAIVFVGIAVMLCGLCAKNKKR